MTNCDCHKSRTDHSLDVLSGSLKLRESRMCADGRKSGGGLLA